MNHLPPIEKIYEAWTAIADDRVKIMEKYATVLSSDGTKEYVVKFDGNIYSSNDNATFWRGYPGYPVIAVLMLEGKLPLDYKEAELWKNINWNVLNKKHKNKYSDAVKEIARQRNINQQEAFEAAQKVMKKIEEIPIIIRRKI